MPTKNRELPRNLTGPGIRRLRSQAGLTQAELAARCGSRGWDISRDVVARIEGQVRWVSDAELLMLATALGVSILDLYPPKSLAAVRKLLSSPEQAG